MSLTKRSYSFVSSHRFSFEDTPEQLSDHAYEVLSRIPAPWGLEGISKRGLREYAGEISTGVSYSKDLVMKGGAIKSFSMGFMNRKRADTPANEPVNDDRLRVDFRLHKVSESWKYVMREVFPAYVEAMGAYFAVLEEEGLEFSDSWDCDPVTGTCSPKKDYVHSRIGVSRIWPANYWDRELCMRAFSQTPEDVVQRLASRVAEARVFRDGALIICSYDIMPHELVASVDAELRPVLTKKA